jgi:ABC-2 type transport system ATP-binding protein
MSPAANDLAVDLTDVDKRYSGTIFKKGVHALRGVNMTIERGAVFGLLGPNGAGKSTLVKILMTVISPTHAKGTMLGHRIGDKATLARVGYLPEHHKFPEYLTGAQVVDFFGALAGTSRADRKARIGPLLELVGMSRWADTKIKSYSKGMRQRIGIAQALVNEPDLIVLDEPTDGVDPVGRRDIRNVLVELRRRGKTVLLNSHLLSELEMVCDRVAIMVQGKVVRQGTIDQLTAGQQRYEIEIVAERPEESREAFRAALRAVSATINFDGMQGATPLSGTTQAGAAFTLAQSTLRVSTTEPPAIQPIVDALRARGVIIRSLRPIRPSLEDLFMEAVTDPNTGLALLPGAADEPGRSGRDGGAR